MITANNCNVDLLQTKQEFFLNKLIFLDGNDHATKTVDIDIDQRNVWNVRIGNENLENADISIDWWKFEEPKLVVGMNVWRYWNYNCQMSTMNHFWKLKGFRSESSLTFVNYNFSISTHSSHIVPWCLFYAIKLLQFYFLSHQMQMQPNLIKLFSLEWVTLDLMYLIWSDESDPCNQIKLNFSP